MSAELRQLVRDTAFWLNTAIGREESGDPDWYREREAKALVCRLFESEAFAVEGTVRVLRSEPGGYDAPEPPTRREGRVGKGMGNL